ncbi:MAG: hypothetical protein AAFV74_19275 [Pseudomonadota bacterium]
MVDADTPNYEFICKVFSKAIDTARVSKDLQVAGSVKELLSPVLQAKFRSENDVRALQQVAWTRYFQLIRPKFSTYIPRRATSLSDSDQFFVKRLLAGWSVNKTERPQPAFAAYCAAHLSNDPELVYAAKQIDLKVLEKPFRTVFEMDIPKTLR